MASTNRIIYNDDYYVPPSDTDDEGDTNYYVTQSATSTFGICPSNETVITYDGSTEDNTDSGLYSNFRGHLSPSGQQSVDIPTIRPDVQSQDISESSTSTSNQNSSGSGIFRNMNTPSPLSSPTLPSPSTSENSLPTSPTSSTFAENLDPPIVNQTVNNAPTPVRQGAIGIPRSLFDVHDTDSEDESNTDNPSDPENEIIVENQLNSKLMENFDRDEEDINDFSEGWEWLNTDTDGASYGPFTGTNELLIHPDSTSPIDYLKLFFPNSMFHTITTQTNLYANRKKQSK